MAVRLHKMHQATAPLVQNVGGASYLFGDSFTKYFDSTAAHSRRKRAYLVSFFPRLLALQERGCTVDSPTKAATSGCNQSRYSLTNSLWLRFDDRRRVTRTSKTVATNVDTSAKKRNTAVMGDMGLARWAISTICSTHFASSLRGARMPPAEGTVNLFTRKKCVDALLTSPNNPCFHYGGRIGFAAPSGKGCGTPGNAAEVPRATIRSLHHGGV